jgi:hypothetical protein
MFEYLRSSRRSRNTVSFRPLLDLLEDRIQPSGLVIGPQPPMPIDPIPPIGPPTGVVTVSTQELDLVRGGSPGSFTVALTSQPSAEVDVTLAAYDPNAGSDGTTINIDHPHLAFLPGNWATPQPVNVSAPAASTPLPMAVLGIFGTTTSTDTNFDAQAVPPIKVDVTDGITNNPAGVVVSTSRLSVQQGGPSVTYTIALASQPSADVTVTISQVNPEMGPGGGVGSGGSMIGAPIAQPLDGNTGGPLTVTPQTLTFTSSNWATPQTVTVAPPPGSNPTVYGSIVFLDDTITSSDPNYNNLQAPPVVVAIATPGVMLSTQWLYVSRGGNGDSVAIALTTQPTAPVTITIAQLGGDALQISPTTLTFGTDNWATPQTVKVGPPTSGSGEQFDTLTLSDSSSDPTYNNTSLPSLTVDVKDPTAALAGLVVSTGNLTVTAGGPSVTYTIALASQPAADVTVAINQFSPIIDPPGPINGGPGAVHAMTINLPIPIGNSTTLNVTPQKLLFTSADWSTPQTVTVSAPAGQIGPFGSVVFLTDTVTSDDPIYNNLPAPAVAVKVQNNPAYSLVLSTNNLSVTAGASASYTVTLASAPMDNVTVTIAANSGLPVPVPLAAAVVGQLPPIGIGGVTLTVAPTTLIFTPQDWNVPQTVTVSASASSSGIPVVALDQVAYTVSSNDPNWNGIAVPPTPVLVTGTSTPLTGKNIQPLGTASPVKTITTLSVPAGAVVGQNVTLTAHVRAIAAHAVPPTGSVMIMDGKTPLATVDVTKGSATLTLGTLGVGGHTLTAVFTSADTTATGSTSAGVHTAIRRAATKTTLSVSANPLTAGAVPTVTLAVTVTTVAPGSAVVNGSVIFRDGSHVLGTAHVVNGVATLNVTTLTRGRHRLTATYQATAETLASIAPVVVATVA